MKAGEQLCFAVSEVLLCLQAIPAVVVNTSGAGDSLVGGALAALLTGASPITALAHGLVRLTH